MIDRRTAGVLLHVTSLPTPFGIGDLGPAAHEWVDRLAAAGQRWWQILPLGPPGGHASPYQCYSAFAGNPLLVSPDALRADGLLTGDDIKRARLPGGPVQFARVGRVKFTLLGLAYARFRDDPSAFVDAFEAFRVRQQHWLDDYALFAALHEVHGDVPWTDWPEPLVRRRKAALDTARREHADAVRRHAFWQFLFDRQLGELRTYAKQRGVGLIGDLPIFVAADSADVWTNPRSFELDRDLRPLSVAGVPPDLFSADGQRWNNPLYDWPRMRRDGFAWWRRRLRATFEQCDVVRLDHFRGFEAYWRIPADKNAVDGRWVEGPGAALMDALRDELGGLPVIAEDLGVITPAVERLRDDFALPGMRVLQFGFGGDTDTPHLPHNFVPHCVAYTGTHDNDTTRGWYRSLPAATRRHLHNYAGQCDETDVAETLIRLAWSSVAVMAVTPVQDLLSLGRAARMNTPGRGEGNWRWRLDDFRSLDKPLEWLAALTSACGRRAAILDDARADRSESRQAFESPRSKPSP